MSELKLEVSDGRASFAPGERLAVTARWNLYSPADAVELRLLWYTHGDDDHDKSDQDMSIVEAVRFESPETVGTRQWAVRLPNGPYSFCGALFSLAWALEMLVDPAGDSHRLDIVVAPQRKEIQPC